MTAMAFVGPCLAIALVRGVAAHALSRRNAGRLSWRRAAFKEKRSNVGIFDRSDRIMIMMIESCYLWWVALALPMIYGALTR